MVGMRAVGILAHECRSPADHWRRGVGEGVVEVVGLEEDALLLGVIVLGLGVCCSAAEGRGGVGREFCGLLALLLLRFGEFAAGGGVYSPFGQGLFGCGGGEGSLGCAGGRASIGLSC